MKNGAAPQAVSEEVGNTPLSEKMQHGSPVIQLHGDKASSLRFIEFQDVWLAYNEELRRQNHFAVEAIDLTVRKGEFISIVGPSGCGKSTFMKLITGLRMPSKGKIVVDGREVTGPLKISGMTFQAPLLLPWRTTIDNVLLPLEIVEPYRSSTKVQRQEHKDRARRLLQKVGLGGYEDKYPWQLSGGMQQRASICRALIHEPKILLLDEPFGALDAFTREELWCTLRDLWTEQKFNVILVTHDLRESVFLADTIYVMSKSPGRFVVRREVELSRPRELDVIYAREFTDMVLDLRGYIGAMRVPGGRIEQ
jgi:NitT/TauT family transport system ATP-binding protein